MITIKGRKAHFTGADAKKLKKWAKAHGLSSQNFFTGLLWEMIMREARKGVFKNAKSA